MGDGEKSLRRTAGANIRKTRKSLGWSQERLAQEAGFHRTFIGQVERAETNVSIDSIERLALALGTPAFHFLLQDNATDYTGDKRSGSIAP